jgi:hypothetical protein
MSKDYVPKKLHIDRRAEELALNPGDGDDLLTTKALALWLGVSEQWLNIGRHKSYGPPYVKIGHLVRYSRRAVRSWLLERSFASTDAYSDRTSAPGTRKKISATHRARQSEA